MWFDGTFIGNFESLKADNEKIADDLYKTKNGTKLFFINRFKTGTDFFRLADPHIENSSHDYVFYHIFIGNDAKRVEKIVNEFIITGYDKIEYSVKLFRKEKQKFYSYGYGKIVSELIKKQEELKILFPEQIRAKDIFIVPLSVLYFECPVCRNKTLRYRGMCEICPECGWEDEGDDNEDELLYGANGETSIRSYREKYLKRKKQNPDYKWWN